ncbi:hypothetical protein AeMF1_007124 [Aphanomyces euteiches]|nr:hypothetical protein AeMF1_007124 [Aphanomyces euteiches]
MDDQGRIWVPDDAVDLQQRLCVIAHQGAAGHRRVAATVKSVSDMFWWATLAQDVETFVKACLHCMQVDRDVVHRPLGSALHAEKPNELIHFDWLSMPMSTSGLKHVLVIKDDMSGFVHLFPAESADATSTATALPPNHQPSPRLGGVAPVTAFTGLPAKTPMSGFVHPTTKEVYVIDWLDDFRQRHMAELAVALNELHRDVVAKSDKLRKQARKRRDEKASVKLTNFSVGDFVLVGSVVKQPTKLSLVWRGPEQVTRVVTDYVMETQQLVPPYGVSLHHACRMIKCMPKLAVRSLRICWSTSRLAMVASTSSVSTVYASRTDTMRF